jgi:HAE1 family hydrophobic/amphiphilic exporter-1
MAVTLAVVAVFIPVAFMEGIVGRFFYQFGVTVAAAVAISYAVSMSLTPTLAARLLKHHTKPGAISKAIEYVLVTIERTYRKALGAMLHHRFATMAVAVGVLVVTFMMAKNLKFTFMPEEDTSIVKVNVEMPMGSRLEDTERQLGDLERQLGKLPGVKLTFATAGAGVQQEVHKGDVTVALVSIEQRDFSQSAFKEYLRSNLKVLGGVKMTVVDVKPTDLGGTRTQQIQFNLRSSDPKALLDAVEKTKQMMLNNSAFVDVDTTYRTGKPELEVVMDRRRAASMGIPAAMIGQTLRILMGGDKITDYRENGDTYDIKAKLPPSVLADADALGALQVRAPSGQLVEIRNIADVKPGEGPSQIEHQAQVRQVTMLADLRGMSLSEAQGIMNKFAATQLPATIQYDFDGQGKELNTTFKAFAMALVLGIVLVYIILAAQFESLVHPLSIMMALPFAVIGAIGGLLLAKQYMSIFAMIGIIMLMGLVTKNGILLVEFTNQLREKGKNTLEALLEAGPVRLRPILMTTVAMIAGMIPVALAKGDGAETRVPMAIAVIGGLVTSTFLTLGVVPVVYSLLDSVGNRIWKKKSNIVEKSVSVVELQNAE